MGPGLCSQTEAQSLKDATPIGLDTQKDTPASSPTPAPRKRKAPLVMGIITKKPEESAVIRRERALETINIITLTLVVVESNK
jgi:hypothetical protein